MVGVPGRSGGCTTCRRRKKGCDKNTPFCGQCIEAGLVCEGYGRHHSVWINSTYGGNRRTPSVVRTRTSDPSTITLNDSLMRVARENRYVGLYLSAFFPNGRLLLQEASYISTAGWIKYHDGICRSEKTLRFITLAHGLSMLATRDNDSQLKFKGVEAHRMALQEMRKVVQDRQRATGDGLLAAVRLFRFYEILYGAEANGSNWADPTAQIQGYYAHTEGEMALFTNRGCDRRWSEPGRYLLASGRIVSFIFNVGRRQCSTFDDRRWMTVPWNDTRKSPLEQLTDILVQTPRLLEGLDIIRASPVERRRPHEWESLLENCSRLERQLLAWRRSMEDSLGTYDYMQSDSTIPLPQDDRDYPVLHMSFFYWSCSIILYTTIHIASNEAMQNQVKPHCSPVPFSSPGHPNYHDERNPTLHAHRIIHALPLSYKPHAGGYAALSSTFPLGMAVRYLLVAHFFPHGGDSGDTEYDFLQQTLSRPFMGAYIARFINHLQKVDTPVKSLKEMPGWHGTQLRAMRWWFGPSTEIELEQYRE